MIVNTSRGALIGTEALIDGLKRRRIGAAYLDVYEEESDLFYEDRSDSIVEDDVLVRLIAMPNVIITSHQAVLTREALNNIAAATVENLLKFKTHSRASTICRNRAGSASAVILIFPGFEHCPCDHEKRR